MRVPGGSAGAVVAGVRSGSSRRDRHRAGLRACRLTSRTSRSRSSRSSDSRSCCSRSARGFTQPVVPGIEVGHETAPLRTHALAVPSLVAAAPATMRVDYYHTGNDKSGTLQPRSRRSSSRCPGRAIWRGPSITSDRGKYFFEVSDAASGKALYSRGFASIFGEWETTGEAQDDEPDLLRIAAVSSARSAGHGRRQEAGRQEHVPRDLDVLDVDPADKFIVRQALANAGRRLIKLHEAGDPADETRSADPRRRLYSGGTRQVRTRRAAADGRAVCDVAVQGARARHQRLGSGAGRGAVGHFASVAGHLSSHRRSGRPTMRSIPSATS